MKIPLIGILFRSIKAYFELFTQGAVISSSGDEDVEVRLTGYISGDVQVRIHHRKGTLLSATNLQEVGGEAVVMFKRKFNSLKFLPAFLITLVNLGIFYIYFKPYFQQLESILSFNIQDLLKQENIPYLVFPALSAVFMRTFGKYIIKFLFQIALWIRRLYNYLTRRKVKKTEKSR